MKKKESEKMQAAKTLGALGGKVGGPARAKALKPSERTAIAKKGADARWHGGAKKK